MRIIKIVNSEDEGGVFTCEEQYLLSLKRKGHIVDLIILGRGNRLETYKKLANQYIELPELKANLGGSILNKFKQIYKMRRFAYLNLEAVTRNLRGKYDAIIYRRPVYMFLAGGLATHFKSPAYWHMPNTVNSTFAKYFYSILLKINNISPVANSIYTRNSLRSLCKDVVYPGFDLNRVKESSSSFRSELNIGHDAHVYGIVARVCYDKAQDLLVEAFCESVAIKNGAHLIIAGGEESVEFMEFVKSKASIYLDKQVHFIGKITDLPKFYSSIDIAVNSRRNVEAFGISVAEGLGAGKPVLAYYLGGPSEMIKPGYNGWLVNVPTVEGYKNAINKSIADFNKWHDMGQNSKKMSKEFEVNFNVDKLLSIITRSNNVE